MTNSDKEMGSFYESFARNPRIIYTSQYTNNKSAIFLKKASSNSSAASHDAGIPVATPVNETTFNDNGIFLSSNNIRSNHSNYFSRNDDFWFWMWLCDRDRHNNYSQSNSERTDNRNTKSNFAAWAFALIIIGATVLPAALSAFYLIGEVVNNCQRLYYNEGYIQAAFGFLSIVSSLSLATYLADALIAKAITGMCISAGFANPLTWSFLILSLLVLCVASVFNIALQGGLYSLTAAFNKDALYPKDPGRFSIDVDQASQLRHVDRDKAQMVITAIHHDMTKPGILGYHPFFMSKHNADNLSAIRTLRNNGTIDYQTTVGEEGYEMSLNFTTKNLK